MSINSLVYVPVQRNISARQAGFQNLCVSPEFQNRKGWVHVSFGPLPSKIKLDLDLFILDSKNVEQVAYRFLDTFVERKKRFLAETLRRVVASLKTKHRTRRFGSLEAFCLKHCETYLQESNCLKAKHFREHRMLLICFRGWRNHHRTIQQKKSHQMMSRKRHLQHTQAVTRFERALASSALIHWKRLALGWRVLTDRKFKARLVAAQLFKIQDFKRQERERKSLEEVQLFFKHRHNTAFHDSVPKRKKKLRFSKKALKKTKYYHHLVRTSFLAFQIFCRRRCKIRAYFTPRGLAVMRRIETLERVGTALGPNPRKLDVAKSICEKIALMCYFLQLVFTCSEFSLGIANRHFISPPFRHIHR